MMLTHRIRHLPVLDGGKLVGIVSQRDLELVKTFPGVDPDKVSVEAAMTPDPYTVAKEDPIGDVAKAMADHKYGCAVVSEGNRVLGVVTTVDMCRVLAEKLGAHTTAEAS